LAAWRGFFIFDSIKESTPMIDPSTSPLAVIHEKEHELAEAIRLARERAQARLAEARARANALKEQAEREGMQQAEQFYQDGIARARAQAEAQRAAGQAAANQLRENGTVRLDEAVEYIVRFVLPKLE
jgi:V/A-type H+-transporting ATPase subunit G/H